MKDGRLPSISRKALNVSLNSRSLHKLVPFVTELRRSHTLSSSLPSELCQYYSEFTAYIDSFNKRLGNFLERNESMYLEVYQRFADMKMQEIKELHKSMSEQVEEHSKKLYEKEINQNRAEIVMLKAKLYSLSQFYDTLEGNFKKLKEKTEHTADENKFLRAQVKAHMSETNNFQLIAESINESIVQLQAELTDIASKEKTAQMHELLDRIKKSLEGMQKPRTSLEFALESASESILKQSPKKLNVRALPLKEAESKRSKSEVKGSVYKNCINKLKNKNDLLAKRVSFLKAKMGSCIYQRSELEDIFIDCINSTKKEIRKRTLNISSNKGIRLINAKLRLRLTNNIANSIRKIKASLGKDDSIPFDEFTGEDKLHLLTLFVCNERIVKHVYDFLFPRYERSAFCYADAGGFKVAQKCSVLQAQDKGES